MKADANLTDADRDALRDVAAKIDDPKAGLPDPVFAFSLAVVPMINVDLLVFDDNGRVLLAWRQDEFSQGWHVPGGIIRKGETLLERVGRTAKAELGVEVACEPAPAAIAQLFGRRGHFISLVHVCRASTPPHVSAGNDPSPGDLAWFDAMPRETYPSHGYYFDLIDGCRAHGAGAAPVMIETWVDELSHRAAHPLAGDVRETAGRRG